MLLKKGSILCVFQKGLWIFFEQLFCNLPKHSRFSKKQVLTIWPVIYLKNNQIEQNDGFNAEKRNVQIQNQSIADALQNRCS